MSSGFMMRRRAMMQAQGGGGGELSDYVQNGLVHHLDGIVKGSTPNSWTDLIGGIEYSGGVGSPVINPNNVYFNGNSCWYGTYTPPLANVGTIEAVFEKDNTGVLGVVYSPPTSAVRLAIALNASDILICGTNSNTVPAYHGQRISSSSVSMDRCIINGMIMTADGTNYITSHAHVSSTLGARFINGQPNGFFVGKIYSVRIYDRRLTEAEVLQNLAVDRIRFGIG